MSEIFDARANARDALANLYLPTDAEEQFKGRIRSASIDHLATILEEAGAAKVAYAASLKTKYSNLFADAEAAFVTDSAYAVTIAEAARANLDHQRAREDPEAVRVDAARLRAQGASLNEVQRVLHTSRENILSAGSEATKTPQEAPQRSQIDPGVAPPEEGRPVIPSKPRAKSAKHGTVSKYARGCRCDECRKAKSTYARERRAQK